MDWKVPGEIVEVRNSSLSRLKQSKGLHRSLEMGRGLSAERGRAAVDD